MRAAGLEAVVLEKAGGVGAICLATL
nr:hypothetical protein [Bradyrhizobium valentinum]